MRTLLLLPLLALLGLLPLRGAPVQDPPASSSPGARLPDDVHVLIAHFKPLPGETDALREAVLAASRRTEGVPGLLEYLVVEPQEESDVWGAGPITVVSIWESRRAMNAYRQRQRAEDPGGPRLYRPGEVKNAWILDGFLRGSWRAGATAPQDPPERD